MILSAKTLPDIAAKNNLTIPELSSLELTEKVLQFGTGVLLRGLPDYFIDHANKNGIFNGRVVVVKSTSHSNTFDFDEQDNLYTQCIRGIENGNEINQYVINSAISRVINANDQWEEVLKCAANKEMQVVVSNTTEVGIVYKEDEVLNDTDVPFSFPGKLVAFLHKRFQIFEGSADAGMVILPTELIVDNGTKLKDICVKLAQQHFNDNAFTTWLTEANDFCDTLVDRIVPGALPADEAEAAEAYLGYEDNLMIMAECYSLWAIQSNRTRTKEILSFATVNPGMVITEDIEKFRNLKLRILNGAHTFSCALALLSGFETVKEAMADKVFEQYIKDLMHNEIGATLVSASISLEDANTFSNAVLDRFRNPFLDHKWSSISMNYSSKMVMRNLPTLLAWYDKENQLPEGMALGFAAYLYFLKADENRDGKLYRNCSGNLVLIDDQLALRINDYWHQHNTEDAVQAILSDEELWKTDLSKLKDFKQSILENVHKLQVQQTNNVAQA